MRVEHVYAQTRCVRGRWEGRSTHFFLCWFLTSSTSSLVTCFMLILSILEIPLSNVALKITFAFFGPVQLN